MVFITHTNTRQNNLPHTPEDVDEEDDEGVFAGGWLVSSIRYPAPRSIPLHFYCRTPTNMGSANSYYKMGHFRPSAGYDKCKGNLKDKCKEKLWERKKFVSYAVEFQKNLNTL